ncbi:MAG: hypothetical protein GXP08_02235 [Gammaproteobacteria bacterium]|nr:hypothetical protein [Gammaproteobacteria bacterium]
MLVGCELFAVNPDNRLQNSPNQISASQKNSAASIEAPLVSANDSLLAMMRYWRFVNGLRQKKEQLAAELKRVNDAYFIRPNERSTLKRAMLLMIPDTGFHDRNQADQLLAGINDSPGITTPALQEYAGFLRKMIERQELAAQRYSALLEKLEKETALRKKIQAQLEALKSIEESLSQRQG